MHGERQSGCFGWVDNQVRMVCLCIGIAKKIIKIGKEKYIILNHALLKITDSAWIPESMPVNGLL